MRKLSLLLMAVAVLFIGCGGHDDPEPDPISGPADQTVLMYMPWAGDDLYPFLLKNMNALETAIENNGGLGKKQLMYFICFTPSRGMLINVEYKNGRCVRDTLETMAFGTIEPSYTTTSGIVELFNKVKSNAPAKSYGLVVGCHGLGWLPKGTNLSTLAYSKVVGTRRHVPVTRIFGSTGDRRYQTEVSSLAKAIQQSFGHTDYILFDDCYMSTIEVAYDLKDVTDYLIASPTEVMGDGMPYATIGGNLLRGDYNGICDGFYNYYKDYTYTFSDGYTEDYSCGTIAVINCKEIDNMASVMKTINSRYQFDTNDREKIQVMDGYEPTVFFDMGDYLTYLCKDASLLSEARSQLNKMITYKRTTGQFYSYYNERKTPTTVFTGITISDPTNHRNAANALESTAWWKATH